MLNPAMLRGAVSDRTVELYQRYWGLYEAFAGDAIAEPATLARWRSHLVQNTEYAPTTINGMLNAVRAVMRAAVERQMVSRETLRGFREIRSVPLKALKHRLKPNRTKITPGQMRTLVDQPDTETLIGLRDRALLLTLATSGCRVSEVIGLEVSAISHVAGGWAFAVQGKTDTESRMVPISIEAKAAIDAWVNRKPAGAWLFPGWVAGGPGERHISAVGVRVIINRHAAGAGLSNIKPHDFRRFVGTELARSNPRHAQRVLGHRDISTTMQYYVLDDVPFGCTDDLF